MTTSLKYQAFISRSEIVHALGALPQRFASSKFKDLAFFAITV